MHCLPVSQQVFHNCPINERTPQPQPHLHHPLPSGKSLPPRFHLPRPSSPRSSARPFSPSPPRSPPSGTTAFFHPRPFRHLVSMATSPKACSSMSPQTPDQILPQTPPPQPNAESRTAPTKHRKNEVVLDGEDDGHVHHPLSPWVSHPQSVLLSPPLALGVEDQRLASDSGQIDQIISPRTTSQRSSAMNPSVTPLASASAS